jgi:AGZA family xanthine/uracil permease-like MFS transporter
MGGMILDITTMISRGFDLYNNGTDIKTEVLAGATAFLATMYIILVNPAVLSEAGLPFGAVLTATVLVSAFSSILMGLYAKNPIVVAPGMSINYLFVYTVVEVEGVPWDKALGCVFWAGVIFLLLTVFDRRKIILEGVPPMLRYGFAGGIGLFIASLGFQSAGFVVPLESGVLGWGKISATTLTFLAGFIFTAVLMVRRVRGSLILGIAATALLARGAETFLGMEEPSLAGGWWSAPDFSLLLQLDLLGSLSLSLWPVIFVFLLSCLFDSLATCVGVCEAGNLIDEEGDPRNLDKSLRANALGVVASAAFGTSPSTCFVESAAGVQEGGRTGLVAVVAGILFLPFLFLSPLLSLVPTLATAPILVLVGVFMLKPLIYVRWERFDDAIPFFMAMFLMPLTYSITQGIIWGCLSWTVLKAACGKRGQVPLVMWAMALLSLLLLIDLERFVH